MDSVSSPEIRQRSRAHSSCREKRCVKPQTSLKQLRKASAKAGPAEQFSWEEAAQPLACNLGAVHAHTERWFTELSNIMDVEGVNKGNNERTEQTVGSETQDSRGAIICYECTKSKGTFHQEGRPLDSASCVRGVLKENHATD